jgi:hypothetical protein
MFSAQLLCKGLHTTALSADGMAHTKYFTYALEVGGKC